MSDGKIEPPRLDERRTRTAMRAIISAQCAGVVGVQAFRSGFLLSFFSRLGINSTNILFLLSFGSLVMFTMAAFAYIADRWGKKKIAYIGLAGTILGYSTLAGTAFFFTEPASGGSSGWGAVETAALVGVVLFGVGQAMFSSGWYALLSPIVPLEVRGRFFGRLRLSWQTVSIGFFAAVTWLLSRDRSLPTFGWVLLAIAALAVVRTVFYIRIPELEKPIAERKNSGFMTAIIDVVRTPGFLPFNAYIFMLMLFTGAAPSILQLLEKDVLGFDEKTIVLLGNVLLAGSMAGFFAAGKLVDRFGAKLIFVFCHFGFGLVFFAILLRGFIPAGLVIYPVGSLTFFLGFIYGASSVAITTELFKLLPVDNKSLAGATHSMLVYGGSAISGLISVKIIELGILRDSWTMFGLPLSHYDALLLGCSVMIVLLVITLGQVPSVLASKKDGVAPMP